MASEKYEPVSEEQELANAAYLLRKQLQKDLSVLLSTEQKQEKIDWVITRYTKAVERENKAQEALKASR